MESNEQNRTGDMDARNRLTDFRGEAGVGQGGRQGLEEINQRPYIHNPWAKMRVGMGRGDKEMREIGDICNNVNNFLKRSK